MYKKPQLTTIEKANLISNEIKNKLGYNPVINIFDNDKHIVTFFTSSLVSYELELLTEIKNKFQNNFQCYAERITGIETVFIVKP